MSSSSNDVYRYYPITIVKKDSDLQLSLYIPPLSQQQSSPSLKIAIGKDERLENLDISKGLIELLQINGFTVEKILDDEPTNIAEKLGIDNYVAQIIFKETKKAISKINADVLLINK